MKLLVFLIVSMAGPVHAKSQEYVLKTCSKIYKGDCGLIASIALEESRYKPSAFNPEGSYGLMQVKCSTARMMGFKGKCEFLFDPITNLRWAIRYVENQKKRFTRLTDVIAAYNSGTPIICKNFNPGKCVPGQYWNQAYVDKVLFNYMVLKLSLGKFIHTASYP